ncbi:MAG: xylulokinase [Promethearchaeia archaeon]
MNDLFLGFDCSTQSLTAVIIDNKKIVYKYSVNFDADLPQYNTKNGVILFDDGITVHSYPLMWVEALDLLLAIMKDNGIDFSKIRAISGSAQQHGTVYLNEKFEKKLNNLNPYEIIRYQIDDCFSRRTSPIWMDSSTTRQCEEIRNALGGKKGIIEITGSNSFERFSAAQIRKFFQQEREAYDNTSIIHLVSSFMASILIGKNAPIDHADGSGMNLMNIFSKEWDEKALNATAPGLKEKLPPLTESSAIIGTISPYFIKRYGFEPNTRIIAWSGDNPNSLIGTGLISKGKVAISLGTSDTYFGFMEKLYLDLKGEGHVFCSPIGNYMSLICFKNGSLARESIKNQFNLNWDEFSEILRQTPPGNYGRLMLPYFMPEIVPLVLNPKVYRFGFDENDLEANVRAIIEAQFLSMRLHSEWIKEKPSEILATGGGSANKDILQVAANIFNVKIRQFEITDSAALGAAIRCMKSYYDSIQKAISWDDIIKNILKADKKPFIKPQLEYKELYDEMLELYKKYEDFILRNKPNPEKYRQKFIEKYFKQN